jgi:hypothetical protein
MWGESRYNVLVKQVEGCSDHLQSVVDSVEQHAEGDDIAREIVRRMKKAIEYLDSQALKMLSPYDPMAPIYLARGLTRDPRRGMVKKASPPDQKQLGTANEKPKAIKRAPEVKKKKHYHPK